ncbi:MAG: hypothetical protein U1F43_33715 [Myxococcota bacterium]
MQVRATPRSPVSLPTLVVPLALAALVSLAAGARAEPIAVLGEDPARVAAIAALLPTGAVLRDLASFRTEAGRDAALVLWATGTAATPEGGDDLDTCPGAVAGEPLTGVYHLGLALAGERGATPPFTLASDVTLPAPEAADGDAAGALSLPLRNRAVNNYEHWGQGKKVAFDSEAGRAVGPTKLLRLADYTGDGKAYEVRFVSFVAACGHLETLLAGYSPDRHAVTLFPIITPDATTYWHDNLFGNPADRHATTLTWRWACGDHGADTERRQTFRFDRKRSAWRLISISERPCRG